jgi:hypothetical protein
MCARSAPAQGFVNLDFEAANLSAYGTGPAAVPTTNALPGWTAYTYGSPASTIFFNTVSVGAAAVSIQGPGSMEPVIQGNYTVYLQGSSGGTPGSAGIGQSGQIPAGDRSLSFWGFAGLDNVAFNGQTLPLFVASSTPNYNIYEADISGLAGQTGQLLFTAPPGFEDVIDNIQFSTSPAPEPSTFGLLCVGGLLCGLYRWRRK